MRPTITSDAVVQQIVQLRVARHGLGPVQIAGRLGMSGYVGSFHLDSTGAVTRDGGIPCLYC